MENKWISVNDKLPEQRYGINGSGVSNHVLTFDYHNMAVCYYDFGDNTWMLAHGDKVRYMEIKFWMPLPAKP